jgi:hypothetical protein
MERVYDSSARTYDTNGINGKMTAAMSGGILLVNTAGNGHAAGQTCSVRYPAWRSETLGIGAIATQTTTTLHNGFLGDYSDRGLSRIGYESGSFTLWSHPSVVLTAPGEVERYPNSASGYAGTAGADTRFGTSYAAPIVSGSAALLLHQFGTVSGMPSWAQTGRHLFTNMMLMGDGWWSGVNSLDDNWGVEPSAASQSPSPSTGFGKLKMHYPTSADPTMGSSSTWKWKVWDTSVAQGVNKWWPANPNSSGTNVAFPSNVTHFKWAFTYFPSDMNDYGSMGMEVFEAPCNSANPTTGTLRFYDWTTSSRKRIQIFGNDVAGKCLWMVIKPYYTPGTSVAVQHATYYHSGTASPNH